MPFARRQLALVAVAVAAAMLPVAATAAGTRPKLGFIGVTGDAGFSAQTRSTVEETLVGALDETHRFRIISRADVAAVLTADRQRQVLGCDEDLSCVTEIAGALGVDFVGTADVGRLGAVIVVNLKIIDLRHGQVAARLQRRLAGESALAEALPEMAREIVALLPDPARDGKLRWTWVAAGTGLAAAAVGAGLEVAIFRIYEGDRPTTVDGVVHHSISGRDAARAATYSRGANGSFAVAATAALVALVVYFVERPAPAGETP